MDKINVIAFDLAGTLINERDWKALSLAHLQSISTFLSDRFGIRVDEAQKLVDLERQKLKQKIGYEPPLVSVIENLGINKKTFYRLIDCVDPKKYLKPNKHLAALLAKLRQSHILCIVTDTSRKTVERALKAYGISVQIFNLIICGDEMKESKPNLEPYKTLLDNLGENASNVVFIGDRAQIDLAPAKKLGMKTILIQENMDPQIDIIVRSLVEFLDYLG